MQKEMFLWEISGSGCTRHREEWRWSRLTVISNQTWVQQLVYSSLPCVFPITGTVPGAMPQFTITSWKLKSWKRTFLSMVNIHPTALQDILSSLQSWSAWWSLFLHITETEGRKISHEDSEVKDLSRAEPLLLISPCKFSALSECREKAVAIETSGGKCTLYHVLHTFSRRSFNLSLPPCNFTETIMLIKPLNVVMISKKIK